MKLPISTLLVFILLYFVDAQNTALAQKDTVRTIEKIAPDHIKLQFAGGIGLLSIAGGWEYGKKNIWESDIYMGYLPKFKSESANLILTVKQLYSPYDLEYKSFTIEPLTASMGASYIFGKEFSTLQRYNLHDAGFYEFPTSINFLISVGQRINFNLPKSSFINNTSVFYDINTNLFYIISNADNSELKMYETLHISLGIKFKLDL